MSISILVRLREGRYDAGGLVPAEPEWPPHPARLFCALVASLAGDADDAGRLALMWLESQGLPHIWAAAETTSSRVSGYVVVNATSKEGGNLTWPGRTNQIRQRSSALPADHLYAVGWPEAQPDQLTVTALARLAGRVPYVGRTTSPAEVTVTAQPLTSRPGWTCFVPTPLDIGRGDPVRIAFPGYLRALEDAYADGHRAWHVPTPTVHYAPALSGVDTTASAGTSVPGPYQDLLVWTVSRPSVPISGDNILTVTQALRRAALDRIADPVPAQVSGHGADDRPHVAFLGLLDAGHQYARGHLLGVALAVPAGMPVGERRALLRGMLGAGGAGPMNRLNLDSGRVLRLDFDNETRPWGAQPDRWGRPARDWVTVTPMMLDRHPPRNADVAATVADCVARAGYPRPVEVNLFHGTPVPGGVARMRAGTVKATGRAKRPMLHCRIRFAQPVTGPVLAGALRYLGGGLFVPEGRDADD